MPLVWMSFRNMVGRLLFLPRSWNFNATAGRSNFYATWFLCQGCSKHWFSVLETNLFNSKGSQAIFMFYDVWHKGVTSRWPVYWDYCRIARRLFRKFHSAVQYLTHRPYRQWMTVRSMSLSQTECENESHWKRLLLSPGLGIRPVWQVGIWIKAPDLIQMSQQYKIWFGEKTERGVQRIYPAKLCGLLCLLPSRL